jgi:hypothetical protein
MSKKKSTVGPTSLWKGHFNTIKAYGVARCGSIRDFLGLPR